LVLGGTGAFGSRLCRLLVGDSAIEITIAARRRPQVEDLAHELGVASVVFDWRRDLDRVLGEGGHDVLVHTAGPFQGQDYAAAELCIRHGVHYLDLADDAAFVCGIDRLDAAAAAAGVLVCAGASTAPALTAAVVEEALKTGPVERVVFGILPGNDIPRGRALVEAILSRAGHAIADQPGRHVWGNLRRMSVPGLGRRWAAACDLPEPSLFARRFGVRQCYAGAGLELPLLHHGLWLLSGLVRGGLVRSLVPVAAPLAAVADGLRGLGTDRGGLRMDLESGDARRTWCLVAEGGDGPFIPITPVAALLRKLACGDVSTRGAIPCVGLLSLGDIEAEWRAAGLRIASGWSEDGKAFRPSLYRRALGASYCRQSRAGQALHDAGPSRWTGRCTVDGGATAAARVLSWLFRLPRAAEDAEICVEFSGTALCEIWTRRIGGRAMQSRQYIGLRKPRGWIVEQFGVFAFDLELIAADGRLQLLMRGMRCCGLPLPRFLWPRIAASEREEEGRFRFDVRIDLPAAGRLVHYRGWLTDR
jgi:hypothetical protein